MKICFFLNLIFHLDDFFLFLHSLTLNNVKCHFCASNNFTYTTSHIKNYFPVSLLSISFLSFHLISLSFKRKIKHCDFSHFIKVSLFIKCVCRWLIFFRGDYKVIKNFQLAFTIRLIFIFHWENLIPIQDYHFHWTQEWFYDKILLSFSSGNFSVIHLREISGASLFAKLLFH